MSGNIEEYSFQKKPIKLYILRVSGYNILHIANYIRMRNMPDYRKEIERRRTFAIISHPDAGKTTLTEKLLLYGGAARYLHHLLGHAV